MPSLADFQRSFGTALADRSGAAPEAALARALTVHRNTSAKAAQDALAANYPVVRALFGEEPFAACALSFIILSPPREARLNAYGAGFDSFLASYAPTMSAPYMPDVARLERLCTEALFAADAPALDGAQVALDPEAALRLHPAVRFAAFASPALSIWQAHHDDDSVALAGLEWAPEAALVSRPGGEVQVHRLAIGGLAFLEACADGRPLGSAAAAAAQVGGDLVTLFSALISAGAFA